MTTALLTLLVLIELARLVLQYRSGKTYAERQEKTYCMASEVENCMKVVRRDLYTIRECLKQMSADKWELVTAHRTKNGNTMLFFTRKKIKNFVENGNKR